MLMLLSLNACISADTVSVISCDCVDVSWVGSGGESIFCFFVFFAVFFFPLPLSVSVTPVGAGTR